MPACKATVHVDLAVIELFISCLQNIAHVCYRYATGASLACFVLCLVAGRQTCQQVLSQLAASAIR